MDVISHFNFVMLLLSNGDISSSLGWIRQWCCIYSYASWWKLKMLLDNPFSWIRGGIKIIVAEFHRDSMKSSRFCSPILDILRDRTSGRVFFSIHMGLDITLIMLEYNSYEIDAIYKTLNAPEKIYRILFIYIFYHKAKMHNSEWSPLQYI